MIGHFAEKSDLCIWLCNIQGWGDHSRRRMINFMWIQSRRAVFEPLIILHSVTVFSFERQSKLLENSVNKNWMFPACSVLKIEHIPQIKI